MNRYRAVSRIALVLFTSLYVATSIVTPVFADPGGRTWGYGYFTNRGQQNRGFNRIISGGLPNSTDKTVFKKYILNTLSNGSIQNKTGAQFIVQLMRGAPYDHSRPSQTAIDNWVTRLDNGNIYITLGYYTYDYNSGYSSTYTDDMFYPTSDTRYSLIFRDSSRGGAIVFVLKQDCGNPLDQMPGLPSSPPVQTWDING